LLTASHLPCAEATYLMHTKHQIYSDLHREVAVAVDASHDLIERMVKEPDFAEGVAAFVEKRRPSWRKE
jgi:enoyl-CoA hydratase/carnithine racemase